MAGQRKGIKQKWKGTKYFDLCFSIYFSCYGRSLISGGETGRWALLPVGLQIFLIFPGLLKTLVLSRSATCEAPRAQTLLYLTPSLGLLVANKTYTKMLNYFMIYFLDCTTLFQHNFFSERFLFFRYRVLGDKSFGKKFS